MKPSFLQLRKSQAAITDLFVAVAVFIILVTITTLIWNLYYARLEARLDYDNMMLKAYYISDAFVNSGGYPEDWDLVADVNAEPPSMIGLASYDHVLSQDKVNMFVSLNNDLAKNIMKVNLYNYYFTIKNSTNGLVAADGSVPRGKYTVNLGRPVLYLGKPHVMEFAVWKN